MCLKMAKVEEQQVYETIGRQTTGDEDFFSPPHRQGYSSSIRASGEGGSYSTELVCGVEDDMSCRRRDMSFALALEGYGMPSLVASRRTCLLEHSSTVSSGAEKSTIGEVKWRAHSVSR